MVRTSTRPRRTSAYNLTGAFDLFPKSYEIVKKNLGIFAVLYIFPLIIGLSNGIWTIDNERRWQADAPVAANALGQSTIPGYVWGGIGLAFIVAIVIAVIIQVMTHRAELDGSEGHKIRFGRLWQTVKTRGWGLFGLYFLVGLITVGGFLLLIIPGIIMLRRYFLAPYVFLDNENIGIWEAMEKSAAMTKKHSGSIYRILGVMLLIILFGILPLIGWLISFPLAFFYSVAPAIRYQELKNLTH